MSDERLTNVEINVANLEKTIGELNDVLTQQWKLIESLKREKQSLEARIRRLEQSWNEQPQAKPPHY